jgi:hypothetical protein
MYVEQQGKKFNNMSAIPNLWYVERYTVCNKRQIIQSPTPR